MRIIGGRDYFDSALAYGRDEDLVFIRKPFDDQEILPFKQSPLRQEADEVDFETDKLSRSPFWSEYEVGTKSYQFLPGTVWFAGKRYGNITVRHYETFRGSRTDNKDVFWTLDDFRSFIDGLGLKLKKGRRESTYRDALNARNIETHFNDRGSEKERSWLIENGVSIAIWCNTTPRPRNCDDWRAKTGWKIDTDGLGDLGFAKCIDPYGALQELSMWVGGVLPRSGPPIVEISDEKTKVAKHGMDKWSFRTMPSATR